MWGRDPCVADFIFAIMKNDFTNRMAASMAESCRNAARCVQAAAEAMK